MTTEPAGERPDLILVVDDDEDIARFVEFNLRLHGFDGSNQPVPQPPVAIGSPLRILCGPERIEDGWWSGLALRDYFVAEEHTLVASVPTEGTTTWYSVGGDAFAWASTAGVRVLAGAAFRPATLAALPPVLAPASACSPRRRSCGCRARAWRAPSSCAPAPAAPAPASRSAPRSAASRRRAH